MRALAAAFISAVISSNQAKRPETRPGRAGPVTQPFRFPSCALVGLALLAAGFFVFCDDAFDGLLYGRGYAE